MPRKKTEQPEPLESYELDEATIEVRDETCWLIGRGMHNNLKKELRIDEATDNVWRDYLTPQGRKKKLSPAGDYMRSASEFAREMERRGLGTIDGCDDSSLRVSIYPGVKKRLEACTRAMAKRDEPSDEGH